METAEEILLKHTTVLTDGTKICVHQSRIKAMKEYAKLAIQEDRKEAAVAVNNSASYSDPFGEYANNNIIATIIDRSLPELK